ncbi:MAG TPA: CheR family methyltransferase [Bryobacteraceae bacterium]|nr:CheR family methyltransferase [Bryobacteraceae bacterium]
MHSPCPVVGFGASAGGLEAFQEILAALPGDTGLAFVFVQHLDPNHNSILGELLAKSTNMPVLQVKDKMPVEPNKVYVIPPKRSMRLSDGRLLLTERASGTGLHLPIDEFFRSLAEDRGSRAIAVLLSGTASDGTLGLRAVKESGGITFAQDQSAKFDAMPRNAIAAGWVDVVMPPAQIAHEIMRICRHPYVTAPQAVATEEPAAPEPAAAQPKFDKVLDLLRTATGVDFTLYKPGTLQRRILRRMALHKTETTAQYVRLLRENRAELKALFHDILISVTGFFRENATFEALKKQVFPALLRGRSAETPVRVWVAGCSTGEEAYSMAICLLEYMRENDMEVPVQIFGTDLSEPALERARAGVYPESIASDVSAERLRRFFTRVDGQFQISRPVRDLCIFAQQNLTKDPPFSKLDLITCRNVLIYLGPQLQANIMRLFHYALKPSGYLVLGLSETVGGSSDQFVAIDRHLKIYSRKSGTASVNQLDLGAYQDVRAGTVQTAAHRPAVDSQRRVDQYSLNRYLPPGALITEDGTIVQFHGHTAPYLEHATGEAALKITRMLRRELLVEFRKLFDGARKRHAAMRGERIRFSHANRNYAVRLRITPIISEADSDTHFLILFEEERKTSGTGGRESKKGRQARTPAAARRLRELEEELASTKQYLESVIEEQQATTEELKSANEEVQSSNEELQSTNEELLTAKEELQSTNEELTTVNEEMHSRNAELSQINNDLNNLLSSVNIPIVMLGNDLRIRRFTPQAEKVLNLLPTDVGRPVSDFKPKIDIPDLEGLFQDVIDNLNVKEREVQDRDGRWFSMWVRPYRTAENKIDGAVMVLFDVTERKHAAEARYRRLFEAARDGILIADAETGTILDLNPYLMKAFGVSRAAAIGVKYWELDLFRGTDLDAATLHELHENDTIQKTIATRSAGGGRADLEVIGNVYAEGERRAIQLNIRDVTERGRNGDGARRAAAPPLASQRVEALGRVAGGVAEDFSSLLSKVIGYMDALKLRFGDEDPVSGKVTDISRALERAGLLARQLMMLSGRRLQQPAVLDLNDLISDLEPVIRLVLPESVQLRLDRDARLPRFHAERGQLEQAIVNLAERAGIDAGRRLPDAPHVQHDGGRSIRARTSRGETRSLFGAGSGGHGRRAALRGAAKRGCYRAARIRTGRHRRDCRHGSAVRRARLGGQRARTRNHRADLPAASERLTVSSASHQSRGSTGRGGAHSGTMDAQLRSGDAWQPGTSS